jgi:hypothetical protein
MSAIRLLGSCAFLLLAGSNLIKAEIPNDCADMLLSDPDQYFLKDVVIYVRDIFIPGEDYVFNDAVGNAISCKRFQASTRGIDRNSDFVQGGMISLIIDATMAGEFARTAKISNKDDPSNETLTKVQGTFWIKKNDYPKYFVKVSNFKKTDIKVPTAKN